LKEGDMTPWEIWVSESQERMMLAVKEENADRALQIFGNWDVEAVVVGRVIKEPFVRIIYNERVVGELDLRFQVAGPLYERPWKKPVSREGSDPDFDMPDIEDMVLKILSSVNASSREWVVRQYDFEVRGSTSMKPLQGEIGRETHGDAAVIKPLPDSYKGLAITSDINPYFTSIDPYLGARSAVDEMCRNLAAVGARPDSIGDCLNFGNPEKPERMGNLHIATRGLAEMARALHLPFISGNVSLYNEGSEGTIPPTPTVMGIGIVDDIRKCVTSNFKKEGNGIYLIGGTKKEMGGSEYYQAMGLSGGKVPGSDVEMLKKSVASVIKAINSRLVSACHDISTGGLASCLAEMAMGGKGAEICLYSMEDIRPDFKLFSESNTRWVMEVNKGDDEEFKALFEGVKVTRIGEVKGNRLTVYDGEEMEKHIDLPIATLYDKWSSKLQNTMG